MTGLLKAVRLDHQIMRPRYPILLLLLAVGVAVGSLRGSPQITIALVTIITAPVGGSYFAVYEASRLDHLYGTLPLKRAAGQAGIYAHTAVLVAVNGLLATVIAWWIAPLQDTNLTGADVAVTLSLSLLGACVYIGLLYPVYLAVPFSKVAIFTNLPFYVVAIALIYVLKRTDWLNGLATVADFYAEHPAPASVLTVAAGISLLVISWAVAHVVAAARRR